MICQGVSLVYRSADSFKSALIFLSAFMKKGWAGYGEGVMGNRQDRSRVNLCQDVIWGYGIGCHYCFSCLLNQQKLRWQRTMFCKTTLKENLILLNIFKQHHTLLSRDCNEIKKGA